MRDLISVLMITYNHEKYIEKAIESVLMQQGDFEIELLIGNDKSPDKTEEILKKYESDKRIKIFNREKNMGATKNEFALQLEAKGNYIAILEGDDYWITKDKLQKQLKILKDNKNISLCYTDSYIVNENNEIFGQKCVKNNKIKNFKSLMVNRGEIPTGTVFFRNIFFMNSQIKEIEILLKSSEIIGDIALFSLLIKEGEFQKLEEFTGAYRYITNSKKSTSYSSRSNLYKEYELYKVFKGIADYYKMKGIKRFLFLERRKYSVKKEIKKQGYSINEYLDKRNFKEKIIEKIYIFLKPIDDFIWSLNKKIYRK